MRAILHDKLDQLYTPIVVIDERNKIAQINASFEDLLGRGVPRLQGLPISRLESLAAVLVPLLNRSRQEQRRCILRQQFLVFGKSSVEADVVVTPSGYFLIVEFAVMDPMRGSRDSLERWQQAQSLELLSQGLCHEIRNPLAGMRGAAQLLDQALRDEYPQSDLNEFTRLILQETLRVEKMLNHFLDGSQRANFKPQNIHQLLDDAIALQTTSWGETPNISKDYDPSIPDLWLESDLIMQVILNLLRNAAQANAQNIVVRTRIQHAYPMPLRSACTVLVLSVEDDGKGVPASLHEILFLPMVSGRPEGTGIGLAVSQQIAQRHGGLLAFQSKNTGSEFHLVLPLEKPPPSTRAVARSYGVGDRGASE